MKQFFFFLIGVCFLGFFMADFGILQARGSYFKFLSMICLLLTTMPSVKPVLCYTVFCDFLLLFTPFYAMGVGFFTVVHLLYLYELRYPFHKQKGQQKIAFFLLPLGLLLSCFYLYSVVLCYITVFLVHIITAYMKKTSKFYKAGLLLFALCDCCTAISFLTGNELVSHMIWILYMPSQILLTTAKEPYTVSTVLRPQQTKYLCPYRLQKKK